MLANFYLICFAVGFLLSLVSFALGSLHLHLPHFHLHHGGPYVHGHGGHTDSAGTSPINFGTITAFLAWFGGTGYLLTQYSSVWFVLAMALATVSGLVGAAMVFWFLTKVL